MKKHIVILFIAFVIALSCQAQTGGEITLSNYELQAQQQSAFMAGKLFLTQAQSDSVTVINKNYFYKVAILKAEQLSIADRGQRLLQYENDWKARLSNNLNINQYNTFLADRDQEKRRMDSLRTVHHVN